MIITKFSNKTSILRLISLIWLFAGGLCSVSTNAQPIVKGQDETIFVGQRDIYDPAKDYEKNNYVDASCTMRQNTTTMSYGLVFKVISGDGSLIKYLRTKMVNNSLPTPTTNTVYTDAEFDKKTNTIKFRNPSGNAGDASNSIIGVLATNLGFCLTEVPSEPLVIKMYAWLNIFGMQQTSFSGDGALTLTFMGGSPTPEYEYGGLKQTVTTHYGGYPYEDLLASGATDKATWVSGPIHPHDGTDEIAPDDFNPELHRIVAPAEADNENESPVMVDRARFNLSFVVNLHPDNTTATRTAITTLELRDVNSDKYLPLTTDNNTPVYYQVSPLNAVHPDEATRHNPSTLPSGTVWGFASDYHWADEADKTTSATVEIPVGLKINDDYVKATRAAEGRIGNVVTYVLDAPVAGEKAAAIASGNAQAGTDYIYKVAQPIYMSTTTTGVENVAAETDTTEAYFTLQGIALPSRPTTPGLYICRRGGEAKVVAIH